MPKKDDESTSSTFAIAIADDDLLTQFRERVPVTGTFEQKQEACLAYLDSLGEPGNPVQADSREIILISHQFGRSVLNKMIEDRRIIPVKPA